MLVKKHQTVRCGRNTAADCLIVSRELLFVNRISVDNDGLYILGVDKDVFGF